MSVYSVSYFYNYFLWKLLEPKDQFSFSYLHLFVVRRHCCKLLTLLSSQEPLDQCQPNFDFVQLKCHGLLHQEIITIKIDDSAKRLITTSYKDRLPFPRGENSDIATKALKNHYKYSRT